MADLALLAGKFILYLLNLRRCIMIRAVYLAALLAAAIPSAWAAGDAGFCKSMCGSERQECKATARKATGNDELIGESVSRKNPFADTASHARSQSVQEQAADSASFHRRQSERIGACEDKYLRCTRTCGVPPKPVRGS
jgi:hypothetical protein